MNRKSLFWWFLPACLAVAFLPLLGLGFFAGDVLRREFAEYHANALEDSARVLAPQLAQAFAIHDTSTAERVCKQVRREAAIRVTCILADGSVLAESEPTPVPLENQAQFPEVTRGLSGELAREVRYDTVYGKRTLFVALPVFGEGAQVLGVLRTAATMSAPNDSIARFHRRVGAMLLLALPLACLMAWGMARLVGGMTGRIGEGIARFANGDLGTRVPVPDAREVAPVAEAANRMAERLDARIQAITQERNERNAVLASMVEGVVAIDREERVLTMNEAAARLFRTPKEEVRGRPIQAVIRNTALHEFMQDALRSAEPVEREIVLQVPRDQILQAHGSILRDAAGNPLGSVIVLNDVTKLRRLETIRRDFVANVSHELKTPITSIKGFVETLQDGAWEDPEHLRRFLGIIAKQANRMNAIIQDLLTLSRIESEKEKADALLRDEALLPVLESAVQLCRVAADRRQVRIVLEVSPQLRGHVNAALLEQGVLNLIDNAVKYSEAGSEVRVFTEHTGEELLIHVADKGRGIAAEHLPRLFERFYRVDKARSREVGGTGLGLAIVKHIAQTHGGRVTVESEVGTGSVFTLHLPCGLGKESTSSECRPGPG